MPSTPSSLSTPPGVAEFLGPYLPSLSAQERPFLTLTYATSLDSHLSLSPGMQTPLSGPESKALTHFLRSQYDSMLVGVSTAIADDPGLNCRTESVGLEQQPRPIILDPGFRWKFGRDARVLETARAGRGKAPWILASKDVITQGETEQRRQWLEEAGGKLIRLDPPAGSRRWTWHQILAKLYECGLRSLMVEGGGGVINELLATENLRLIDSVVVTVAPVYLGREGVNVSPESRKTVPAVTFKDVQWNVLGRDVVMAARTQTS